MKLQSALLVAAILALQSIYSSAAVHYVDLNSTNPTPPYADWSTAATNIQDAVDAANVGDTVLVTNGVYKTGSRADEYDVSNRVAVTKPIILQSANGPAVTLIDGGGAVRCVYLTNNTTLVGFTLTNGVASGNGGGGVWCEDFSAVVTNCLLSDNSTAIQGAGAYGGTLNNCTLTNNNLNGFFNAGGGAAYCSLDNCILVGNNAVNTAGGGVYACTLNSCLVSGNYAYQDGGGAYFSTLNNCTLVNNFAWDEGAGADGSTLNNCIEYYNRNTGYDFVTSTYNNCCTEQLPNNGEGNFTNAPLFVDYTGSDFHLQSNSPCINAGDNPYINWFTDLDGNPRIVDGFVDVGAFEFQSILNHTVHLVNANSIGPIPPYTNWASAAVTIQDAIDVATNGDLILVTNGVYQSGGRVVYGSLTNRVVVNARLVIESVNGPAVTIIQGYQTLGITNDDNAVRCVYLADNAVLSGFTLTRGATRSSGDYYEEQSGGGVWCETAGSEILDCVLTGNSATGDGGAGYQGTFDDCLLTGNSAAQGGGTSHSALNNCTVVNNSGEGAYYGTLNNCIVYYNNPDNYFNSHFYFNTVLNFCCTTPDPGDAGDITNEPVFVNFVGGDFHLQSNSPCVNTGNNGYVMVATNDLEGNPRIVGGTVDIGAYENQTSGSGIPYLKMLPPVRTNNPSGLVVSWQSVNTRTYYLQSSTNLAAQPAFSTIQSNIAGQAGTTSYTDTTATNGGPYFYRVGVQ